MSEIKQIPHRGRAVMVRRSGPVVFGIIAISLMLMERGVLRASYRLYVGFIAALVIVLLISAVTTRYPFKCPDCGKLLRAIGDRTGKSRINKYCQRCDVIWDTGIKKDYDDQVS